MTTEISLPTRLFSTQWYMILRSKADVYAIKAYCKQANVNHEGLYLVDQAGNIEGYTYFVGAAGTATSISIKSIPQNPDEFFVPGDDQVEITLGWLFLMIRAHFDPQKSMVIQADRLVFERQSPICTGPTDDFHFKTYSETLMEEVMLALEEYHGAKHQYLIKEYPTAAGTLFIIGKSDHYKEVFEKVHIDEFSVDVKTELTYNELMDSISTKRFTKPMKFGPLGNESTAQFSTNDVLADDPAPEEKSFCYKGWALNLTNAFEQPGHRETSFREVFHTTDDSILDGVKERISNELGKRDATRSNARSEMTVPEYLATMRINHQPAEGQIWVSKKDPHIFQLLLDGNGIGSPYKYELMVLDDPASSIEMNDKELDEDHAFVAHTTSAFYFDSPLAHLMRKPVDDGKFVPMNTMQWEDELLEGALSLPEQLARNIEKISSTIYKMASEATGSDSDTIKALTSIVTREIGSRVIFGEDLAQSLANNASSRLGVAVGIHRVSYATYILINHSSTMTFVRNLTPVEVNKKFVECKSHDTSYQLMQLSEEGFVLRLDNQQLADIDPDASAKLADEITRIVDGRI